mgnify:CR=1 FL=1
MADPCKYPTRLAPYGLRMPDELKRKVKDAARREGRSMNAQIVRHLREIYGTEGEGDAA